MKYLIIFFLGALACHFWPQLKTWVFGPAWNWLKAKFAKK